ncbi:MAG: hypothetical protein EOP92_34780 [Lysobacteraceae bacterium]|nr:MAG: hypothetical protein EOP92_34780 [Xanthomonadaceae bacterium]
MPRENRRFATGVGVSLAAHLLLLFAYRHAGPPVFAPETPSSITVTIRPPPPPPPQAPKAEAAPRVPAEAAAPRRARRPASAPVIAVPPAEESAGEPFTVQQQPESEPDSGGGTPKFDLDEARLSARQLAGQTRLGREGLANAQFPDPPLETESKFAKAIKKAKRRDCKDGLPGGLLAPLFLMMDKKDHGCKW